MCGGINRESVRTHQESTRTLRCNTKKTCQSTPRIPSQPTPSRASRRHTPRCRGDAHHRPHSRSARFIARALALTSASAHRRAFHRARFIASRERRRAKRSRFAGERSARSLETRSMPRLTHPFRRWTVQRATRNVHLRRRGDQDVPWVRQDKFWYRRAKSRRRRLMAGARVAQRQVPRQHEARDVTRVEQSMNDRKRLSALHSSSAC